MAAVHVPAVLEPILPFVRKSQGKKPNACFDSYAQLVVFAAALGFHELDGDPPPKNPHRTSQIEPVAWEYLQGDRQQTVIQLIGLVAGGGTEIVNDHDSLCRVIEDLAAVGGKQLVKTLKDGGDASFHLELGELLINAAKESKASAVTI